MNRFASKRFWLPLISLLCLGILPTSPLHSQDTIDEQSWRRGYNGLALICRSLGMELQTDARQWSREDPSDSVLVVLGDLDRDMMPVNIDRWLEQGGAVLVASDRRGQLQGGAIQFLAGPWRAVHRDDSYQSRYRECPVVKPRRPNHPVMQGVEQIITNRPGGMRTSSTRFRPLAQFPALQRTQNLFYFLLAREGRLDSRLLACADQSVFANQMLIHGDNARFAMQAMAWLSEGGRKNLLMVVDGNVATPADPRGVDVQLPAPTRDEVLNALKNLPADKLLEFGNTMATVVEDENLVNEFLSVVIEELDERIVMRTVLFLATAALGLILFLRYAGSESMLQEPSDPHARQDRLKNATGKSRYADDRKLAALQLVQKFYFDVTEGARRDVSNFPNGITVDSSVGDRSSIVRDLKKTGRRLGGYSSSWWTTQRLRGLQSSIEKWNHLHENQLLVYDANIASAPANPSPAESSPPV
ncbi:MAG: DUF4350 domain-containing protein [Pirellulaceae bacterium]